MRLGQTSVIFLISKIATSVIGFAATIYFTRMLGKDIYGFYALTLALVSWLGIVKSVGFGKAMVKRMSEDEDQYAYLVAGTLIKTVLTIVVVIGVILFRDEINAYVGASVAEFVVILLVVSIFGGIVNSALKGTHRVHIYAPLSTAKNFARSVLMVALVFVGLELSGMLAGHALGTAVIATVGIYIVRPRLVIPRWRHFRRLFNFAKWSWLGSLRAKSFNDVDIVVLGFFVSSGVIGVYAVAWSLSKFLDVFTSAISHTLFPEMSKLSRAGDEQMVATLTEDALTFAGLFLIPGVIGSAIIGEWVMRIYGPGFGVGHQVLYILVGAILFYAYARQLLNTLNAIDRPDLAFRANGVFIVANIVLNVVLIAQFEWIGAALATLISAVIGLLLAYYYASQSIAFAIPVTEISRQWIAALVMAIFVLAGLNIDPMIELMEWNIATVILPVVSGAAIYFLSYLILSATFRDVLVRNMPLEFSVLR